MCTLFFCGNPLSGQNEPAYIKVYLDSGEEVMLPLSSIDSIRFEEEADTPPPIPVPQWAIEYVAEYNLTGDGEGFLTTHDNRVNSEHLIHIEDAFALFDGADTTRQIDGITYQLPSVAQMSSVFPNPKPVGFNWAKRVDNQTETVEVGSQTITSSNDYESVEVGEKQFVIYAHRFKGTPQESAWRYALKSYTDPVDRTLIITVKPLNQEGTTTLDDIRQEDFWSADTEGMITRVFPAAGSLYFGNNDADGVGDAGYYRTRDKDEAKNPYVYMIDSFGMEPVTYISPNQNVSIRPFMAPK